MKKKKTHEFLTLNPVLGFFAGLSAGVPARESATVDAAAEPGNPPAVGDGWSSRSSYVRLRAERVLRPSLGAGVGRPEGSEVRERDASVVVAGAGVAGGGGGSRKSSRSDDGSAAGGGGWEPSRTPLTGKAWFVTMRAWRRRRSFGSVGSSLPSFVARTRVVGVPALPPFFELRLGNKGESTTAGIS